MFNKELNIIDDLIYQKELVLCIIYFVLSVYCGEGYNFKLYLKYQQSLDFKEEEEILRGREGNKQCLKQKECDIGWVGRMFKGRGLIGQLSRMKKSLVF